MIQCSRCGQQNRDSEFACTRCGMVLQKNYNENTNINSNLTQNYQNQVFQQINSGREIHQNVQGYTQQNAINQNIQDYQPNFSPNSSNVQNQQYNYGTPYTNVQPQQVNSSINKKSNKTIIIVVAIVIIIALLICGLGAGAILIKITKSNDTNIEDGIYLTEENTTDDYSAKSILDVINENETADTGSIEDITEADEIIDEQIIIEEEYIEDETTELVETEETEETEEHSLVEKDNLSGKRYGSDKVGYITLDGVWSNFVDVTISDDSKGNMLQYTDGDIIITLNSVTNGNAKESVNGIAEYMSYSDIVRQNEYNTSNMEVYEMYSVDSDNYRLYITCFITDKSSDMIYVAIESPLSSASEFKQKVTNIMGTHSLGYFDTQEFDILN